MKTFNYEELPAYIKKLIADGAEVLICHHRKFPYCPTRKFIRLPEDVSYKSKWDSELVVTLPKGCYLRIDDPSDIYGLPEKTFEFCYVPK